MKVFAYNAEKDRLDLCLGKRHIQVQPLDDETLLQAHSRSSQAPVEETSSSSGTGGKGLFSEASFSGAISPRDTSHARMAFSGQGRTLAGAQSAQKQTAEVISSVEIDERAPPILDTSAIFLLVYHALCPYLLDCYIRRFNYMVVKMHFILRILYWLEL